MKTSRLEAFSDGVIAIIITIMVLEMKVPHGADFDALKEVLPVFLSYVLSFLYVGIYWNNHHHLIHACPRVTGPIMWANLHLLFWLSLFPFVTGWMGENHLEPLPTCLYGVVLLLASLAYFILQRLVLRQVGPHSKLAEAFGRDWKGKVSPLAYGLAAVVALGMPIIAAGIYVGVALMWLIPDRRIEQTVSGDE